MYKCCYILVVVFTLTWRCVIWHYQVHSIIYKCRSLPVYVVIWIFNDCFKQVLESQILQNNHYVETQITWNNCYVESQITQNNHYLQTQITQNNHWGESQITWKNHYVHVQKLYAITFPYPEDRIFIEPCMWLNDMCVSLLAMKSRWQTLRTTLRPCLQTRTLNTQNSLRFVVSHFILLLLCYSYTVRPKMIIFCSSGTIALAQMLMYWLILFPNWKSEESIFFLKFFNYILKILA